MQIVAVFDVAFIVTLDDIAGSSPLKVGSLSNAFRDRRGWIQILNVFLISKGIRALRGIASDGCKKFRAVSFTKSGAVRDHGSFQKLKRPGCVKIR